MMKVVVVVEPGPSTGGEEGREGATIPVMATESPAGREEGKGQDLEGEQGRREGGGGGRKGGKEGGREEGWEREGEREGGKKGGSEWRERGEGEGGDF